MEIPKIFTRNKYGISIVKCCASCKFKQLDNRTRLCLAGEGAVPSSYVCSGWQMNPTYENVGKGDGSVKTSEYLHYALKRLYDDFNETVAAIHNGKPHERLGLKDIKREFTARGGEVYSIERTQKDEGF